MKVWFKETVSRDFQKSVLAGKRFLQKCLILRRYSRNLRVRLNCYNSSKSFKFSNFLCPCSEWLRGHDNDNDMTMTHMDCKLFLIAHINSNSFGQMLLVAHNIQYIIHNTKHLLYFLIAPSDIVTIHWVTCCFPPACGKFVQLVTKSNLILWVRRYKCGLGLN